MIPGYLLVILGKWLWGYITPEYVEEEQEDLKKKGKEKEKEKKQKVKYVKA